MRLMILALLALSTSACTTTTLYVAPPGMTNRHANRAYATVIIRGEKASSSGVLIRPSLILTAAHTVTEDESPAVEYWNGERTRAQVLIVSSESKLALLHTPDYDAILWNREIGISPSLGATLHTVGHPRPARFAYSEGPVIQRWQDGSLIVRLHSTTGSSGSGVWHGTKLVGIIEGSAVTSDKGLRVGTLCTNAEVIRRFLRSAETNPEIADKIGEQLASALEPRP